MEAADKPADGAVVKKNDATLCGAVEDDLTLVAYMYGLLFQCYADKVGALGRGRVQGWGGGIVVQGQRAGLGRGAAKRVLG